MLENLSETDVRDLVKNNEKVFVLADGSETNSLAGTFRILMRDSGLDKDRDVKSKRSLYSLRHTYAHFSILNETMDVYTLAKQMGTSVKMIELHYGHLQPAQKANVIAGKRMGSKKKVVAESAVNKEKPKLERVK